MARVTPFTEWPPEIRNAIYEELFQFSSPIILDCPSGTDKLIQYPIAGISLLAVCRQVYSEASGILYTRNRFCTSIYCTASLYKWIECHGHGRKFSMTILVDLGTMTAYERNANDVGVYYILQSMWQKRSPNIRFLLVHGDNEIMQHSKVFAIAPQQTRMLEALAPAVAPQLKAIMSSERTLRTATMKRDGSQVSFYLWTSSHHSIVDSPALEYRISENGQLLRSDTMRSRGHLNSLMGLQELGPMMNRISELLMYPTKRIVYDLTKMTVSRAPPPLSYVNRYFRVLFWNNSRLSDKGMQPEVHMTTQNRREDFACFRQLGHWINTVGPQRGHGKLKSISLKFQLDGILALENIRIEVTDLIFHTLALFPETPIHILLSDNSGAPIPSARATSTMYRLRRSLLVFLAELLNSQPRLQHEACPKIWANGELRPREAEFTIIEGSKEVFTNKTYKWGSTKLNQQKDVCLQRYDGVEHYVPLHDSHETLFTCTIYLAHVVKHRPHPRDVQRLSASAGVPKRWGRGFALWQMWDLRPE